MLAVTFGFCDTGIARLSPTLAQVLKDFEIPFLPCCCEQPLHVSHIAAQAHALLLSGGGDSNPLLYAQSPQPDTCRVSAMRDNNEIALCRAFYAQGKPIFGICRGMQTINIALGGTLYQHKEGHNRIQHPVYFDYDTPLAKRGFYHVNSFHHQVLARVADSLSPIAIADDGVVEAVAGRNTPILAVQWHPEFLEQTIDARFFTLLGTAL